MPPSKRPLPEVVLLTAVTIGALCFFVAGDGSDSALREGMAAAGSGLGIALALVLLAALGMRIAARRRKRRRPTTAS